ncbi:MAG: bile acid:sodium symporter [Bacteroidetes bacterium]|nr:bile acid:sodium symporter [Bacteroidota bacterium]
MRWRGQITSLLTNRNLIFLAGIAAGFLLGDKTAFLKDSTTYIIGFILAVATSGFRFRSLVPVVRNVGPVTSCVFLNYIVFGGLMLLLAWLTGATGAVWTGYVVIAATPPAIAIIPFTFNLKGDTRYSISGVFGGNLLGIVLTPLIFLIFMGDSVVSPYSLLLILVKMLIIPLAVSRVFRWKKLYPFIDKNRGILIDYGFLVVAMTVIGLSRNIIFGNPYCVLMPLSIFVFLMFILGNLFKWWLSRVNPDREIVMSLYLMLTIKNAGFAAVVAINLFPDLMVTLPPAILSVLLPLFYIFESTLGRHFFYRRSGKKLKSVADQSV